MKCTSKTPKYTVVILQIFITLMASVSFSDEYIPESISTQYLYLILQNESPRVHYKKSYSERNGKKCEPLLKRVKNSLGEHWVGFSMKSCNSTFGCDKTLASATPAKFNHSETLSDNTKDVYISISEGRYEGSFLMITLEFPKTSNEIIVDMLSADEPTPNNVGSALNPRHTKRELSWRGFNCM